MRLAAGLPGREAQYRMAPVNRSRETLDISGANYRPSAVLVLFCQDANGRLFLPLIERMVYSGVHSGQVALPGGKFEERDGNLQNTALRECREEIGIEGAEVLGQLTQLHIPVSGFMVQPFLGVYRPPAPEFIGQEREVKKLINLEVAHLLSPGIVKTGQVNLPNNLKMQVPYFDVNGHMVWGATAMILSELKEVLTATAF